MSKQINGYTGYQQALIGLTLALLMAATRSHNFASLEYLPSASLAAFFLMGIYVSPIWAFALLLGEAAFLDYAAIVWSGVSDYCISPAYGFLVPAYASLWLMGRWYGQRHNRQLALPALVSALLIGAVASELFSSGSFYLFSGRFAEPSLTEFAHRFVTFFPAALFDLTVYVATATIIQLIFVRGDRQSAGNYAK